VKNKIKKYPAKVIALPKIKAGFSANQKSDKKAA